ncbi:MAG: hypothetical protein COV52_01975 [Gammaproteobacteria bacterium CG11_big_fil_rev_8_21_14_0_20_46_22]|nr:MAG: hypothetical protein COW05_05870 [Gammaproteobacteria bacterium CG12_big_fil_rev_8_21_14_0_65_46_12]PIR11883.1 MAG: hypothetical protein COV52_01975 [Gammaproteobacteria bacterium CG11_big_fil_rev_8_21_14_0_20_46_22]
MKNVKLRFYACRNDQKVRSFDIDTEHLSRLMKSTQTFYLIEHYAKRINKNTGAYLYFTPQQARTLAIVALAEANSTRSRGLRYLLACFMGFLKNSGGFVLGDSDTLPLEPRRTH